jgi:hypothetical protein
MFLRTLVQRTKLADKLMPLFRAPERKLRQVFEITFQIYRHARKITIRASSVRAKRVR